MSGYGCPGIAAVFRFYNLSKIRQCQFALSDFYHCTDYGAHHIPQKTVGLDGEYQLLSGIFPVGLHNCTIIGLYIRVQFGETGEIGVIE